ncbi:lyase family protein [Paenibacillus caseinilyticus]|uniref:Aspartate ammonia-lyase n=1 Tax=Paenibacillus mucilaginosus K02 TaxID=997761 RepID=I0BU63_9BACL|nr:lyase family protein [Paenibacillus mucilaginosus]AFH65910.1 aspartate ammonia-lyase [Paenibacillus mucilaginosus K02]
MQERIEKDTWGEQRLPADAYFGVRTLRAAASPRSEAAVPKEWITALARVKGASAKVNGELGVLPRLAARTLTIAAEEVARGHYRKHFIVDPAQGRSAAALDINMNDVLANRALELMAREKGDYGSCHPELHAGLGLPPGEVVRLASRLACLTLTEELAASLQELGQSLAGEGLPPEARDYAGRVREDAELIRGAEKVLLRVPLSGEPAFTGRLLRCLGEDTGRVLLPAGRTAGTSDTSVYRKLSAAVHTTALGLSELCRRLAGWRHVERAGGTGSLHLLEGPMHLLIQVIGHHRILLRATQGVRSGIGDMTPIVLLNLLPSMRCLMYGAGQLRGWAEAGARETQRV